MIVKTAGILRISAADGLSIAFTCSRIKIKSRIKGLAWLRDQQNQQSIFDKKTSKILLLKTPKDSTKQAAFKIARIME